MKLLVITDNFFIRFGSNAKALWHLYPLNPGEFPQVGAFAPDHRKLCLIDFLKTKDICIHTSSPFSFYNGFPGLANGEDAPSSWTFSLLLFNAAVNCACTSSTFRRISAF